MMNKSWTAYENGLKRFSDVITKEHDKSEEHHLYEEIRSLQFELIQNITQAQHYSDTSELRSARQRLVTELNQAMKQVVGASFIELCFSTSPILRYLTFVYQIAQNAYDTFNSPRVFPSQCRDIVEQFGKRPGLDSIGTSISAPTIPRLYYLEDSISNLIQLVEDFEKRCPRLPRNWPKSLHKKQAEVLHKLAFFLMEVRTFDNSSFEEFICIWKEVVGSADIKPSSTASMAYPTPSTDSFTRSFFQEERADSSLSVNGDPVSAEQVSEVGPDITGPKKRRIDSQERVKKRGVPPEQDIDRRVLRDALVRAFDEEELSILCANIRQALLHGGIDEQLSLDTLKGTSLAGKAQSLIDYCERRGWLGYLTEEIHKARPNLDLYHDPLSR